MSHGRSDHGHPTGSRQPSRWRVWRHRVWVLRSLRGAARWWALRRLVERGADRRARLSAAVAGNGGRLVFVCHGNIMRSAFATRVAREYFPSHAQRVVGGGTHARAGRPAQEVALVVAGQLQLSLEAHRATPLDQLALRELDVIVCMDAMNEANVLAAHPALAARVFRVGDIDGADGTAALADRELPDPYGKGEQVTRTAFEALHALSRGWAARVFG